MGKYHGLTDKTYQHFVVDAGAVYKNYGLGGEQLIGATRDGSTFTIETEIREMPVDGAKGPVKGLRRKTSVVARISAKFIEFTTDLLKTALPGAESTDNLTHEEIRRALQITLADYAENIALIGEKSGSSEPIILGIENALADGGFEVGMVDDDEAGITIQFTAHFDPANLDQEPWFIRNPKVDEEEPGEVGLLDLKIDGDSIQNFDPDVHSYEVDITQETPDIVITADLAGVSKSTVTIGGETTVNPSWKLGVPVALEEGANVIAITLTVRGKMEVYTIVINYTEG